MLLMKIFSSNIEKNPYIQNEQRRENATGDVSNLIQYLYGFYKIGPIFFVRIGNEF